MLIQSNGCFFFRYYQVSHPCFFSYKNRWSDHLGGRRFGRLAGWPPCKAQLPRGKDHVQLGRPSVATFGDLSPDTPRYPRKKWSFWNPKDSENHWTPESHLFFSIHLNWLWVPALNFPGCMWCLYHWELAIQDGNPGYIDASPSPHSDAEIPFDRCWGNDF